MNKRKRLVTISLILLLMAVLSVSFVYAYFYRVYEKLDTEEIALVDVEIEAYYKKDEVKEIIDISSLGGGVIELDISNPNNFEHFNNFRVDIKVDSNIKTYFRVAIFEQFTLTYFTSNVMTKVAVTRDEYSQFNFNEEKFYDNRLQDGYFYYIGHIVKENEEPLVLNFIKELEDPHAIYDSKYTIQIGFIIEAVQGHMGPIKNWGVEKPPWDESESW